MIEILFLVTNPFFNLFHQLTIDTVSFIANGVGLKKKAAASEAALAMLAWLVNNEPDHLHHLSFEELSLRGYKRLNARQLLFPDDNGQVPISLDCVTTGRQANANENGAQKRKTTEPSLDKEVLNNDHLPSKKKPKEKKKEEEVRDNFVNLFPIPLSIDDDDNCDLLLPPPKSKSKAAQRFRKLKKSKLNRSPFPPPPAPIPNLEKMTTLGDVSNPSELSPTAADALSLKRTSEVESGRSSSPLKSPAAKRKKNRRRADPKNGAFAYSPSYSSSSSLSVVSNLVANLSLDDPTLYLSPPSHPPESLVRILPADHTFNTADDDSQPTPLFLRAVCHNDLCRHPDHLDPGKHQKHQVLLAECQASSKTLVELLGSS